MTAASPTKNHTRPEWVNEWIRVFDQTWIEASKAGKSDSEARELAIEAADKVKAANEIEGGTR